MVAIIFTRAEAKLLQAGYTEEQVLMRREMEAAVKVPAYQLKAPVPVSETFAELMGEQGSDPEVTEEAYRIINEAGDGLLLNLKGWAIVQKLVELGIVSGRAGS